MKIIWNEGKFPNLTLNTNPLFIYFAFSLYWYGVRIWWVNGIHGSVNRISRREYEA